MKFIYTILFLILYLNTEAQSFDAKKPANFWQLIRVDTVQGILITTNRQGAQVTTLSAIVYNVFRRGADAEWIDFDVHKGETVPYRGFQTESQLAKMLYPDLKAEMTLPKRFKFIPQ